jgi:16S rRNA (guanine1207-N2)-methyltransferase
VQDRGPGHYFSPSPDSASRPRTIELTLPDVHLQLQTDAGTFSPGAVDAGTKLLLLEGAAPVDQPSQLLDLGCGYGPVALVLAHRAPQATVWAIDVNERARDLCRRNAEAHELANVRVAAPDEVPDDVRFDGVWSNPPIRIGKQALHDLLARWLGRAAPGARAHLVVQRHLGADSLARWLDEQGWPTHRARSRGGYRLLDVVLDPGAGA